jgi:hypothetical protein
LGAGLSRYASCTDISTADMMVSATSPEGAGLAVFARGNGSDTAPRFYLAEYDTTSSGVLILRYDGNYAPTLLASHPDEVFMSAGDSLSISTVGTTITAYVNGVSLCSSTDSTYSTGCAGIFFFGAGETADDFTVEEA